VNVETVRQRLSKRDLTRCPCLDMSPRWPPALPLAGLAAGAGTAAAAARHDAPVSHPHHAGLMLRSLDPPVLYTSHAFPSCWAREWRAARDGSRVVCACSR
jgi:hypothetical protein